MTKARDLANVISGSGTLNANVIPALPASKITSGTFADARLSSSSVTQHVDLTSLSASNLTSGTVPSARLSLSASDVPDLATSKITSGTFADARLSASSVTQHVDLSNLNASNLTSGSIPNARVPSGAVTQHVSAVTQASGTWSPSISQAGNTNTNATYSRTGNIVTCVANGSWSSRPHHSNYNYVDISGLPITPRSGSDRSVGMGLFGAHNSGGNNMLAVVIPGSTTMRLYNNESNLAVSNRQYTNAIGGGASEYLAGITGPGQNSTHFGGYRLVARNVHQSAWVGSYWTLFVTYQV